MSNPDGGGWYPDPTGQWDLRYWSGRRWTELVRHRGVSVIDPIGARALAATTPDEPAGSGSMPSRREPEQPLDQISGDTPGVVARLRAWPTSVKVGGAIGVAIVLVVAAAALSLKGGDDQRRIAADAPTTTVDPRSTTTGERRQTTTTTASTSTTTAPATIPSRHAPPSTRTPRRALPAPPITNGCDPNYGGCVPVATDVDCSNGSGDGPEYVVGPVPVVGHDLYDLDPDGNGIGCDHG